MLPTVITSSKLHRGALAAILSLALAVPAAPAFAFNQREQDVLKGVFGVLLLQGLVKQGNAAAPPKYTQPQPVYAPNPTPRVTHSVYRTPAAQAFNAYSASERRLIQRRLARFGYYRGAVDGSFGPGTYSAVAAYAQDQGQARALTSTQGAYSVYDGLIF